MLIAVDDLWTRVGPDGMPPLAKLVRRAGTREVVGRVVDATEYPDGGGPFTPVFEAELLLQGTFFKVAEAETFDAALNAVVSGVPE